MAQVHVDSEPLLHCMPASVFNSSFKFTAVLDESSKPLIFTVGQDKRFYVLKENQRGSFVQIDLTDKLGISGEVDAFAITQSTSTSRTLFIAAATRSESGDTKLYVLEPIVPAGLTPEANLRRKLLLNADPPTSICISKMYIVSNRNFTSAHNSFYSLFVDRMALPPTLGHYWLQYIIAPGVLRRKTPNWLVFQCFRIDGNGATILASRKSPKASSIYVLSGTLSHVSLLSPSYSYSIQYGSWRGHPLFE
jgi:hypothetical protein